MSFSLTDLIPHWSQTDSPNSDHTLDQCLQHAIESINPLLKQSRGYPEQYRSALQRALDYVDRLTQQIPAATAFTSEQFGKNTLVRALFASPKELEESLKLSIAMREYTPDETDSQMLYALMGVRWEWRQQFGMEEHDGLLQSDVPQRAINFKDHTFTLPAPSEKVLRQHLRKHFIDRLSNEVSKQIAALQQKRDQLYLRGKQLESVLRGQQNPDQERELEQLWEQWRTLNQQLDTDHAIEHFTQIMEQPEQLLRLEPVQLSINNMGIERSIEQGGTPLNLLNLHGADRRVWTILLVQFPWQPPPSDKQQLEAATRWLALS